MKKEVFTCELCLRVVCSVSRHHLIPREEGEKYSQPVSLCQPCHSTIHLIFTNQQLAKIYNTIPALKQAPGLQKYLNWIRNKKLEKIANRRSK